MHRLLAVTLSAFITLSLAGCDASETGEPSYLDGKKDNCTEMGGAWDAAGETCVPAPPEVSPHWLMVQDADAVTFAFDDAVDEACPAEAFWSGTMTMTGADAETLWFSDRPFRHAYTQTTAEFITGFVATFPESAGSPNAVLSWKDAGTGAKTHAVVELRAVDGSSPSFDATTSTVAYQVCGLKLDDPSTLEPLPDDQQVQPPADPTAEGEFSLFIDSVGAGAPKCGGTYEPTDWFWMGVCGHEGFRRGSCSAKTQIDAAAHGESCASEFAAGAGAVVGCNELSGRLRVSIAGVRRVLFSVCR